MLALKYQLGCAAALIAAPVLQAKLDWSQTTVQATASAQDKTVQAEFSFRNAGDRPVELVRLETSCHCTTAAPDHWKVAAGAQDVIRATLWIGGRTGRIDEWIEVATDAGDAARLHLVVLSK